jgi:hypothetical protein
MWTKRHLKITPNIDTAEEALTLWKRIYRLEKIVAALLVVANMESNVPVYGEHDGEYKEIVIRKKHETHPQ